MCYLRKSQIFFILLCFIEFSSGRDTLSSGQTLKDGDFLLSAKETFTLRFFSPGKSANRYLGICNYKTSDNRVVWVANRDSPVNDTSGVLSFQKSNNLVIYGHDLKIPIWTTNFLGPGKNYSAQLEDTGNLVVFQEDKKRVIAWQSFDHPTDTWLSQMKFGVNLKTGFSWSLRSWKSDDDPGAGEYSFRIDKDNRELTGMTIYKGSDKIWRSGPLNGRAHLIADMSTDPTMSLTYVNSEDEVYLMYSVHNLKMNSMIRLNDRGIAVWMTMFPDSLQWKTIWQAPDSFCDNYGRCGPNGNCKAPSTAHVFNCDCLPGSKVMSQPDYDAGNKLRGCVLKRDPNDCRNGEGFLKLPGTEMPDTATARVDRIQGLKACGELCLIDCNCTAYVNVLELGNACVMWYGDLMDTKQSGKGGVDLFVRADVNGTRNSKQHQHYSSSNKKRKVATLVTSISVAIFIVVFILCWLTYKRKGGLRSRAEQRHGNLSNGPDNSTELVVERQKCGDLPLFDLISLIEATNNFSHENKLGQGGFGSVYKGTLKNGLEIAVKRLSDTSKQGLEEFKNEAALIAKHTHRNLVRLLGYCAQQEEKLLIYEFMPNKSLDSLIFEKTKSSCLDWEQRINIIMGITRGMVYLHHDCTLRIIHRDLKASNVLLDAHMNPKISDFGMARFFEGDQVEGRTNRVVGTYGYMSPEYAANGTFSIKSDVFSFGVLLLEIITGSKNKRYRNNDDHVNLISKVWELWREERALEIVDPSLGGDYSATTVLRCIHVGLLCLQAHAIHRPTMSAIAFMLSNETNLPTPREPGFYFNRFASDQHTSSSSVGTHSANELTLSVIQPR